jgi:hypothetical protein
MCVTFNETIIGEKHMQRLTKCLFLVLLAVLALPTLAQAPQPVLTALQQLNALTGQSYSLGSIGYEFNEEVNNGPTATCPTLDQLPTGVRVYIVGFDTDFDGGYEWRFAVTSDNTAIAVCQSPTPVGPVQPSAPTDIPLPTATPAACEGLTPRLGIGSEGRVMPGSNNIVRQSADRESGYVGEMTPGTTFSVVDGPRCADDFTWWLIYANGLTGWTVEGAGGVYFLELAFPLVAPVAFTSPVEVCDSNLPPRLTPLTYLLARVLPGDANNLRETPSTSATKVGELAGEMPFTVLDGPVCAEGYTWWAVMSTDGSTGWTVEGANGAYFLEPVYSQFKAVTGGVPLERVGSLLANGQEANVVSNALFYNPQQGLYVDSSLFAITPKFDGTNLVAELQPNVAGTQQTYYDTPVVRVRQLNVGSYLLTLPNSSTAPSDLPEFEVAMVRNELLFDAMPNRIVVTDEAINTLTVSLYMDSILSTVASIVLAETPRMVKFDALGNVFVATDNSIQGYRVDTAEKFFEYAVTGFAKPFTVSADGRTLAYIGMSDVFLVDTQTGQLITQIAPVSSGAWQALVFSPRTSTFVALVGNDGDANSYGLYSYDVATQRNFYQPLSADLGAGSLTFNEDGRFLFVGSDKVPVSVWGNR